MILYTLQRNNIDLSKDYVMCWDETPDNWRVAYRWMSERMKIDNPPVWCWKKNPSYEDALALCGNYYINSVVKIKLDVPKKHTLKSSYYAWNKFLDYVIVNKKLPKRTYLMFSNLIQHTADVVQVTIPYIKKEWVVGVKNLDI